MSLGQAEVGNRSDPELDKPSSTTCDYPGSVNLRIRGQLGPCAFDLQMNKNFGVSKIKSSFRYFTRNRCCLAVRLQTFLYLQVGSEQKKNVNLDLDIGIFKANICESQFSTSNLSPDKNGVPTDKGACTFLTNEHRTTARMFSVS